MSGLHLGRTWKNDRVGEETGKRILSISWSLRRGGIFQVYLILSGFTGRDQQRGKIGLTDWTILRNRMEKSESSQEAKKGGSQNEAVQSGNDEWGCSIPELCRSQLHVNPGSKPDHIIIPYKTSKINTHKWYRLIESTHDNTYTRQTWVCRYSFPLRILPTRSELWIHGTFHNASVYHLYRFQVWSARRPCSSFKTPRRQSVILNVVHQLRLWMVWFGLA